MKKCFLLFWSFRTEGDLSQNSRPSPCHRGNCHPSCSSSFSYQSNLPYSSEYNESCLCSTICDVFQLIKRLLFVTLWFLVTLLWTRRSFSSHLAPAAASVTRLQLPPLPAITRCNRSGTFSLKSWAIRRVGPYNL